MLTAGATGTGEARATSAARSALSRAAVLALVLAALWGLWEAYRWLWIATGWTWPFPVDDITMPHIHSIVGQLFEPSRAGGPLLISVLFRSAL